MEHDVTIRTASAKDAAAILEIYRPYVEKTAISFEYEVPTLEEFTGRIRHVLEKYPYLVAEKDGRIVGYAYAGVFIPRRAYDWSVELSIYVDRNLRNAGVGGKLYGAMGAILKEQGVLNMNACIGYPEKEDEYLTKNSAEFHAHLGFRMAGLFHDSGCKFGRWYHMVWMEKLIGEHRENQPPVKSFDEVRATVAARYGIR